MRAGKLLVRLLSIVLCGVAVPSSAWGQLSPQQQIDLLQQQLDQLRAQTSGLETGRPVVYQTAKAPPISGAPTVPGDRYFTQPAKPAAASVAPQPVVQPEEKKYPDVKISGFFHLDAARFSQSSESRAVLGDIQDGTGFRRARLSASGNVSERGTYLVEFDMAQAQPRFVDVWGQIKDTPLGNVRIGRFRQPFGMAGLTSAREIPLMERPTAFALSPFRQTGLMLFDTALDERVTWAASGFRTQSDNFGNVYGDDGGLGTAARLTFLPRDCGDDDLTHFGLGHSYLDPARNQMQLASQDEIFAGQQPNLGPTGLSVFPIAFVPPFVQSGVFNVDHANLFNLEAARSWGHTLVQAEQTWSHLSLPTGETATVHAGYITLRHVLTGEVVPYNRSGGVFGRVKPDAPLDISSGNWGAWEVVAQLSNINLNPLFGLPGVPGPTGRLESSSLGLNWYWWNNAKSQFEWVNGDLNRPGLGDSISNTFAARVQFDF